MKFPIVRVADIHQFERLDAAVTGAALGALASRYSVDILDTCESTNTLLLERAQDGAPSGSVVACEHQTAGRGRRGRTWLSAPGDSLTFSLLWRFPAGMAPPAGLSLAAGVAVARALERMGAAGIQLKWPNDVLAASGKLAGVLVEVVSAAAPTAVIGIGINVRLPRAIADAVGSKPADLASVMVYPPSRNLLLANLLIELHAVLEGFAQNGFAAVREEWLARNAHTGCGVRIFSEGAQTVEGRCAGVDSDGALLLDTGAGMRRIISGEVSLRAT